jgi:putative phosphonate metabolism protein
MQLDQAGHDQIAGRILGSTGRAAFAEFGDAGIGKSNPAALDDAVREHNPGVAKYGIGAGRVHLSIFPRRRAPRKAVAAARGVSILEHMADPRYAIYFTPEPRSALDRFGAELLGYDAAIGEDLAFPDAVLQLAPDWRELTCDPRKYGFHATLKAPHSLAPGKTEADLLAACEAFAGTPRPIPAISPVVGSISGFIAVVPAKPSADLERLAADCVSEFDSFRAPLSAEDRARRNPSMLTPRQREYLDRWGYPYVMEDFRFHMTLTGRLPPERHGPVLAMLEARFSALDLKTLAIDRIALSRQDDADSRFRIVGAYVLRKS